jgi:peflin
MSGRDTLPHFPAPEKAQRPSSHSQGNMQGQPYQQGPSGVPGGYPPAGYQVGPPAAGYVVAPQGYQPGYAQSGFNPNQGSINRPASSQPPQGIDPQLYNVFRAADTNNSGQLSELELSRALVNGDWTPFDAKTIKLMVKMFDADQYVPPHSRVY